MDRRVWFYIGGIQVIAAALTLASLVKFNADFDDWLTFSALLLFASFSQVYKAITSTSVQARSTTVSYSTAYVFFGAALFLLPPFLFALVIILTHLIEWLFERLRQSGHLQTWYVQPFNIAMHILAGATALAGSHAVSTLLLPDTSLTELAAALAAAAIYLITNHVLLGTALSLVRNVSLREAGLFRLEEALPDLINFSLGYIVAVLWQVNHWYILPALSPLLLVHRALQVPQLKKEAHVDGKTGLLAAHRLNQLLEKEIERAQRFKRPLAVLMADLDLLRNINNSYGHLAGDAVLEGIGRIINNSIRQYDLAGRFGGEEFCLVLPETEPDEAKQFAERLRYEIEKSRFAVATASEPIQATMSIGVACFPYDATELDDLVHQADLAVYQAKFRGRNQVISASEVPYSTRLNSAPNHERLRVPYVPNFIPRPRKSAVGAVEEVSETAPQSSQEEPPSRVAEGNRQDTAPGPEQATVSPQSKETSSDEPTEPPPTRPTPLLWCYIATICVIAVLLLGVSLYHPLLDARNWPVVALLAILAIAAELFRINLYEDSTFSVSVAFNFAAALLGGLPGTALVSAGIALAHRMRIRSQWFKIPTNWSIHVIAGAAPVLILRLLDLELQGQYLHYLLLPLLVAAFLHYAISTAVIAGAISLSQQVKFTAVWRGHYGWLVTHYLALCMLGLFLALAFLSQGFISLIIFTVPIFMMRYSQEQYVERTKESMMELKRMNRELSRANKEIESASKAIIRLNDELFVVLGKIIDARDPFVSGHATQVSYYATQIGRSMGLSEEQIEMVRQAGFLHDVGKIGIPEQILHKASQLDEEEYEVMKRHVDIGGELLEGSHSLKHLAPFVRHHHERWNGEGYPHGLKGEKIPLEARILAVCDAVEAMASDRPYHKAMDPQQILDELKQGSGTQFDPRVVDAFLQLVEEKGEKFIINSAQEVVIKYSENPAFSTYDFGLKLPTFSERRLAIANNVK